MSGALTHRFSRVQHTRPTPGTTIFADVVEIALPGEVLVLKEPGTVYRAVHSGETPTHYPDVLNGHGTMGFVVSLEDPPES